MDDKIRVLIINEQRLLANLFASVLENEHDIEVIGCSHSYEQAFELLQEHKIDVLLLSVKMKNENILMLTKQLKDATNVDNLVVYGLKDNKEQIIPFIEAGADGIVNREDDEEDLISAIRMAHAGKARLSPEITSGLIDRIAKLSQLNTNLAIESLPTKDLTPREMEVLECLGKNMSNKEIAESLFIEVGTVKNHVHHILDKLNVSSRGEASQFLIFTQK